MNYAGTDSSIYDLTTYLFKFYKYFGNSTCPFRGTFRLPTDPTQETARLVIVLVSRIQRYWRQTILSNGKGHFGPTDRNNRTGQSGPFKAGP